MVLVYMALVVILISVAWYAGYSSRPKQVETKTSQENILHLKQAKICVECEAIFEGTTVLCKSCGSKSGWPLINWIGSIEAPTNMINTPNGWAYGEPKVARLVNLLQAAPFTTV